MIFRQSRTYDFTPPHVHVNRAQKQKHNRLIMLGAFVFMMTGATVSYLIIRFVCLTVFQSLFVQYLSVAFEYMMLGRRIYLTWSCDIVMNQVRFLENCPPTPPLKTYFSLRAKCWVRGGVGGQFPWDLNWSIVICK